MSIETGQNPSVHNTAPGALSAPPNLTPYTNCTSANKISKGYTQTRGNPAQPSLPLSKSTMSGSKVMSGRPPVAVPLTGALATYPLSARPPPPANRYLSNLPSPPPRYSRSALQNIAHPSVSSRRQSSAFPISRRVPE